MLLSLSPLSFVDAAITPLEFALALLAVITEFTPVDSAISPLEDTFAMHFVAQPLPIVVPAIAPGVLARPCDVI